MAVASPNPARDCPVVDAEIEEEVLAQHLKISIGDVQIIIQALRSCNWDNGDFKVHKFTSKEADLHAALNDISSQIDKSVNPNLSGFSLGAKLQADDVNCAKFALDRSNKSIHLLVVNEVTFKASSFVDVVGAGWLTKFAASLSAKVDTHTVSVSEYHVQAADDAALELIQHLVRAKAVEVYTKMMSHLEFKGVVIDNVKEAQACKDSAVARAEQSKAVGQVEHGERAAAGADQDEAGADQDEAGAAQDEAGAARDEAGADRDEAGADRDKSGWTELLNGMVHQIKKFGPRLFQDLAPVMKDGNLKSAMGLCLAKSIQFACEEAVSSFPEDSTDRSNNQLMLHLAYMAEMAVKCSHQAQYSQEAKDFSRCLYNLQEGNQVVGSIWNSTRVAMQNRLDSSDHQSRMWNWVKKCIAYTEPNVQKMERELEEAKKTWLGSISTGQFVSSMICTSTMVYGLICDLLELARLEIWTGELAERVAPKLEEWDETLNKLSAEIKQYMENMVVAAKAQSSEEFLQAHQLRMYQFLQRLTPVKDDIVQHLRELDDLKGEIKIIEVTSARGWTQSSVLAVSTGCQFGHALHAWAYGGRHMHVALATAIFYTSALAAVGHSQNHASAVGMKEAVLALYKQVLSRDELCRALMSTANNLLNLDEIDRVLKEGKEASRQLEAQNESYKEQAERSEQELIKQGKDLQREQERRRQSEEKQKKLQEQLAVLKKPVTCCPIS